MVYFPCDNLPARMEETKLLQQELIENITEIGNKYKNILVVGDFNGNSGAVRLDNKQSSNVLLVDNLVDVADLGMPNTSSITMPGYNYLEER